MTAFEDFVNAELPKRPVLIKGAAQATGDPNANVDPEVVNAPLGTFYLQDDISPKLLWQRLETDGGGDDWSSSNTGNPPPNKRYVSTEAGSFQNGSLSFPYATAQDAVDDVIALETADPTLACQVIIDPGDYTPQNINLENTNLTNLSLLCSDQTKTARDGLTNGCVFTNLVASVDTENITYFSMNGFKFTQVNLECDITTSTFLSAKGSLFRSCEIQNLYLGQGTQLVIDECKISLTMQIVNFLEALFYRTQIGIVPAVTATIKADGALPGAGFGAFTTVLLEGDVDIGSQLVIQNINAGFGCFVSLIDGSNIGISATVDANSNLVGEQYAVMTNVTVDGSIALQDSRVDGLTLNAGASLNSQNSIFEGTTSIANTATAILTNAYVETLTIAAGAGAVTATDGVLKNITDPSARLAWTGELIDPPEDKRFVNSNTTKVFENGSLAYPFSTPALARSDDANAVIALSGFIENSDVDTGTETVDSFADTVGGSCVWTVKIIKGANVETVVASTAWDAASNTIAALTTAVSSSIGVIDVTLSCDISADNVRLRATATSDDWAVKVIDRVIA